MSHIRTLIDNLFPNSQVGELFANSDGGQGIIDPEIDRYFTFQQIEECIKILSTTPVLKFLDEYDNLPNLKQFFKRLEKRMNDILFKYENSIDGQVLQQIIKNNRADILNKYPGMDSKQAQLLFAKEYIQKHKQLKDNTFEQVKDFFDNPIAWI